MIAGDGTRLYTRETRGPNAAGTPIVCANGIGVGTFFWPYLEAHFAATRPVVCWDYRGHDKSEFPRDLTRLTIEETAEVLGISPTTAKAEWRMARAWLRRRLEG